MSSSKRQCRTPFCAGEPVCWIEWAKPGEAKTRESDPACATCAGHLQKYARRKGLATFLTLVPLEQATFPF